ncbi:carbon-nitrogen hydrolase family protein [Haloarchaeobius amylolyticus]|uniref:Carbon-nitrogen hydrolase family protein n=1 Tax=Haloarchaeobius amylolyticus TaxID=1198296 RepID=A0ABD6BAU1_9EURY
MTEPRIATCQFEPELGNIDANLDHIERLAASVCDNTALAVFPELCVTGYDVDLVQSTQIAVPGPITDRLRTIVRETGVDLVVGLPEIDGDTIYNSLVYLSADGVEGVYRKQRLWGAEADSFSAAAEPTVVETPVGRAGFLLCYDLNFPELALEYSNADCDILIVSAAWRESFERDWRVLCRARALDQTCFVVGSNHCGSQRGRRHAGSSLIASPQGEIVAQTTTGIATASTAVTPETLSVARERNPVRQSRRKNMD